LPCSFSFPSGLFDQARGTIVVTAESRGPFSIVVEKSRRKLHLYENQGSEGELLAKTYQISLGCNPRGRKDREGDGATPEGEYYITHRNAASKYYLSLGISYPNRIDAVMGYEAGIINENEYGAIEAAISRFGKPLQKTGLGGEIFIHGGGTAGDWTEGCIALENADMKELFDQLPLRTKVTILP
jgi:murein L,D-transpeptidase YafK